MPITNDTELKAALARRLNWVKKQETADKDAERAEAQASAMRTYSRELQASIEDEELEIRAFMESADRSDLGDLFDAQESADYTEYRLNLMEAGL